MSGLLLQRLKSTGLALNKVTVLDAGNDPFRVDTPAGHRDAQWLAAQVDQLGLTGQVIHLRGLHYQLLDSIKPNGEQYINNEKNWQWLGQCAKAARFLTYIPFESIDDRRNKEPVIKLHEPTEPEGYVEVGGLDLVLPDADELEPTIGVSGFRGVQPYKLVIYGEKSSLEPVLGPLAERYKADLYLMTGEISDTYMHRMAKVGAEDGRPMVVLAFTDCDPSGKQMPISIGRKLQAFQTMLFPDLDFELYHVGLHPDHVREHGLPSTPLKDTEKRADAWFEAFGVHQTEIDAIVKKPEVLRGIAGEYLDCFFDRTLEARVRQAQATWLATAAERLEAATDPQMLAGFRELAAARLAELQDKVQEITNELRFDPGEIDLPEIVIPEAVIPARPEQPPLIDSRWSFAEQCDRLKAAKEYRS